MSTRVEARAYPVGMQQTALVRRDVTFEKTEITLVLTRLVGEGFLFAGYEQVEALRKACDFALTGKD